MTERPTSRPGRRPRGDATGSTGGSAGGSGDAEGGEVAESGSAESPESTARDAAEQGRGDAGDAAGRPDRTLAVCCLVVAGALVATALAVIALVMMAVEGRQAGKEPDSQDGPGVILTVENRCESVVLVGWALSDSAVPLTADQAERFFDLLDPEDQPAEAWQMAGPVLPGTSAELGLGRPATVALPRLLLVQTTAGVRVWAMNASELPPGTAVPSVELAGRGCEPRGLSEVRLGQAAFPI